MDSLITAAARALAAGDALGALKRVALRDDPPALALRGIAMAQLGEHPRARELLRLAARGFGAKEELARARCVVAEAEVALAMRDLSGHVSSLRALAAATATLDARADHANAQQARLIAVRRLLLLGQLDEAAATLDQAQAALTRAHEAALHAGVPALLAEVAELRSSLEHTAARRLSPQGEQALRLDEVAALMDSGALVLDACRHGLRAGDAWLALVRRPVLFTLARALADAWPSDADRTQPAAHQAEIVREYGPFGDADRIHGVTHDGQRVWAATGAQLLAFDPQSGEASRTLNVACDAGTAFDGTHLYQIAETRIDKIDPATGQVVASIPAPGSGSDSGLTWAEGSLWVGQYRDRKIHQVDPQTGRVLRRIHPQSGAVLERLAMPSGTGVSGLESDGAELFYCGGGMSGKVRAVQRPKRTTAISGSRSQARFSERAELPFQGLNGFYVGLLGVLLILRHRQSAQLNALGQSRTVLGFRVSVLAADVDVFDLRRTAQARQQNGKPSDHRPTWASPNNRA